MTEQLKQDVCEANLDLHRRKLVFDTFGNVSGVDRRAGVMVIKPSGVICDELNPARMVCVSLDDGAVVDGGLRPSSDSPTHLVLYRAFEFVGGIAHTHSLRASAWAQAGREIPCLGTTHADFFDGPVPCTRALTDEEITGDYEVNTGRVIVEAVTGGNPRHAGAVLVAGHGPFTWGRSPAEAVRMAVVLEFLARLASETERLNPAPIPIQPCLLNRHYARKHGPAAYYGQMGPA